MAKVFIEETTLTAIGDAIREKEGTAELVPVNDMATRIKAIESGGGGELPEEAFELSGSLAYSFYPRLKNRSSVYCSKEGTVQL